MLVLHAAFRMKFARHDLALLLILLCAAPLWLIVAYLGERSALYPADALSVKLPSSIPHEREPLSDRAAFFRWTDGDDTLQPINPGGQVALRLRLSSGLDAPTQLAVLADRYRAELPVLPGLHVYDLLLPPQPGDRIDLTLRSPTVTIDGRELGVVFVSLSVTGDGPQPPLTLIAAMLIATLGAYGLLRQAGMRPWATAATVLALQLGAAAWQAAGFWRYALLDQLLLLAGAGSLAALVITRLWPPLLVPFPPRPAASRRDTLALVGLLLLALALCWPWLTAADPVGDLKFSARRMGFLVEQGFAGAFTFGGDYMPFRLAILRALAYLVPLFGGAFYDPVPGVTHAIIKIPSLIALLLSISLIFRWARRYGDTRSAALLAGLFAVAPPVWLNVGWWGQVDVLLALPMIATIALFDRAGGRWSWLCWACGLLIKPQAIILAPLLFAATVRRYGARGLAQGGALAFGLIALASVPFVLAGEGPGLIQAAVGSVGRFPQVTNRAYNLWWLVVGDRVVSDLITFGPLTYRTIGFALVGLTALAVMLAVLRRPDGPTMLLGAATLALAFFALPTQIHERYAFFALPFLLLWAAADRRGLIPFGILTVAATINILGAIRGFNPVWHEAIKTSFLTYAVAWVSLAVLGGLLAALWQRAAAGVVSDAERSPAVAEAAVV
jgi:Gpi18-like mannosyltransferase